MKTTFMLRVKDLLMFYCKANCMHILSQLIINGVSVVVVWWLPTDLYLVKLIMKLVLIRS